jgi:hypothetical protein
MGERLNLTLAVRERARGETVVQNLAVLEQTILVA